MEVDQILMDLPPPPQHLTQNSHTRPFPTLTANHLHDNRSLDSDLKGIHREEEQLQAQVSQLTDKREKLSHDLQDLISQVREGGREGGRERERGRERGREGEREGGREGGREGEREGESEGGRKGGWKGGREEGRKGGREEGRKGGREEGREGGREGGERQEGGPLGLWHRPLSTPTGCGVHLLASPLYPLLHTSPGAAQPVTDPPPLHLRPLQSPSLANHPSFFSLSVLFPIRAYYGCRWNVPHGPNETERVVQLRLLIFPGGRSLLALIIRPNTGWEQGNY